jgi:tRNA A-37 threonylcarbamoyl transferase component Bud32
MADLEISVKYKSLPARATFLVSMFTLPLWGVMAPCAVAILLASHLYATLKIGGAFVQVPLYQLIQFSVAFLLVAIFGAIVTVISSDTQIFLSKMGLSLPTSLAPTFGFRKQIPWSAIDSVELMGSGSSALIRFKGPATDIKLKLASIEKDHLEQLLLAVQLWAGSCERNVALLELHEKLQGNEEKLSYTAMWEDELARRFSTTAFVPLEPGAKVYSGKLKVVRQLSFGGLSAIYLCQQENQALVVLKESVVPASQSDEMRNKAAQMFQREAFLLMKLDHPSLVKVLDHFTEGTRSYLLLQYINGQDLRQLVLQHGIQTETNVLRWAVQISQILQYLHGQEPPIIHRDLTPDNLVLDSVKAGVPASEDKIVLIDFGAANEFIGNATGTLVGKQCFIAPEQFRGKAVPASDIYALGCTLYFLLTGQEPDALSVSHPRSLNAQVSEELDQLIAQMTAMDVEKRIASADEVMMRIEKVRAGLTQGAVG